MSPSTNTRSDPTVSIITLGIVPFNSPFVKQYDPDNTINNLFTKLIDKIDKQDEYMEALFTKQDTEIYKKIETQLQPLIL